MPLTQAEAPPTLLKGLPATRARRQGTHSWPLSLLIAPGFISSAPPSTGPRPRGPRARAPLRGGTTPPAAQRPRPCAPRGRTPRGRLRPHLTHRGGWGARPNPVKAPRPREPPRRLVAASPPPPPGTPLRRSPPAAGREGFFSVRAAGGGHAAAASCCTGWDSPPPPTAHSPHHTNGPPAPPTARRPTGGGPPGGSLSDAASPGNGHTHPRAQLRPGRGAAPRRAAPGARDERARCRRRPAAVFRPAAGGVARAPRPRPTTPLAPAAVVLGSAVSSPPPSPD
jgi:hypothetical protein